MGQKRVGVRPRSTSNIITDGLVLHLDAGNTSSYPGTGTIWNDLTGNGNNGTLTNGPVYNSSNGGTMSFDGVNDYVQISQTNDFKFGTGDFCYDLWFNANDISNVNGGFWDRILFMGYNVWNNSFSIDVSPSGCRVRLNDAIITTSVIQKNTWFNLLFQRNNGVMYAFINGVLDKQKNSSYNMDNAANYDLSIGFAGNITSNGSYFNGDIPVVKVYNKSLTEQEVLQNYNATKGRFGL
jgi:hypothetical protein